MELCGGESAALSQLELLKREEWALGCRLRLYLFIRAYVYSYTDYTAMDALSGARSRALISDSKTVCCRSCIPHCVCSCFKIKSVYICDSPYSDSNWMSNMNITPCVDCFCITISITSVNSPFTPQLLFMRTRIILENNILIAITYSTKQHMI